MDAPIIAEQEPMLRTLTLPELISLQAKNPQRSPEVQTEYSLRFWRLTTSYLIDYKAFCSTMRDTGAVISGSTALHFIFPYAEPPMEHCIRHDLDIYVKSMWAYDVVRHLATTQGYTVSRSSSDPVNTGNTNRRPYTNLHGIDTVYVLEKGYFRIDVIASAREDSAIFPILHFHSTLVMNILTPNRFISIDSFHYIQISCSKRGG